MTSLLTQRLPLQLCLASSRRSLFSFPSPFGSSETTKPSSTGSGKLRKRGSVSVYQEEKVFDYSPKQLYAVIADVDSYSKFVPFATKSTVLTAKQIGTSPSQEEMRRFAKEQRWLRSENEGERWELSAQLRIGALKFDEAYTSKVTTTNWSRVTAVADDSTIFKHLSTTWSFTPIESQPNSSRPRTHVQLLLEYEFASVLHAIAAGAVWDKVSARMVGAFEDRVKAVHGP